MHAVWDAAKSSRPHAAIQHSAAKEMFCSCRRQHKQVYCEESGQYTLGACQDGTRSGPGGSWTHFEMNRLRRYLDSTPKILPTHSGHFLLSVSLSLSFSPFKSNSLIHWYLWLLSVCCSRPYCRSQNMIGESILASLINLCNALKDPIKRGFCDIASWKLASIFLQVLRLVHDISFHNDQIPQSIQTQEVLDPLHDRYPLKELKFWRTFRLQIKI